jgi:hypothetical protein
MPSRSTPATPIIAILYAHLLGTNDGGDRKHHNRDASIATAQIIRRMVR